jgi:hypothetical protein
VEKWKQKYEIMPVVSNNTDQITQKAATALEKNSSAIILR